MTVTPQNTTVDGGDVTLNVLYPRKNIVFAMTLNYV